MKLIVVFLASVLAVFSAASKSSAQMQQVDATITYLERIALPPDAILEVDLLDTSRADTHSIRMSSQRFKMSAVPMSVQLTYDAALIEDRFTYTVAARIYSGGAVLFRSTTATPVLTRGAPSSVDIVLQKMPDSNAGSTSASSIVGIQWTVFEVTGRALVVENPPTLIVDQNGQFGLYAGCNRFTGKLTAEDGELVMPEQFAGTVMACPEDREKLEDDVLAALRNATGYVRNGPNLALTNAAGVTVLRLQETSQ